MRPTHIITIITTADTINTEEHCRSAAIGARNSETSGRVAKWYGV